MKKLFTKYELESLIEPALIVRVNSLSQKLHKDVSFNNFTQANYYYLQLLELLTLSNKCTFEFHEFVQEKVTDAKIALGIKQ